MTSIRVGSLFSGSGMLDAAVHQVLAAGPAWFCEYEPPTDSNPNPTQAAARLLAYRYPNVPNLGDITAVDWAAVDLVDVITAGFPCQDVSSAGKRIGMRPGTRSGQWSHAAYAISQLRPELVVIENVRGLLSADAHCDVEPCPWCVGDGTGRLLRACGGVVGDLASLGYVGRIRGLRAADVGAPHGRFRVFITAWPAARNATLCGRHPAQLAYRRWRPQGSTGGPDLATANSERLRRGSWWPAGSTETPGGWARDIAGRHDDAAADATGNGRREGRPESGWLIGGSDAAQRGDAATTDPDSQGRRPRGRVGRGTGATVIGDGAPIATNPSRSRDSNQPGSCDEQQIEPVTGSSDRDRAGDLAEGVHVLGGTSPVVAWGPYEPAIRRWERILGRSAPAPTQVGQRGGQQLSPAFVEWMQGWPQGWVTDVPGLSRNDQLKIAGNGVVPQQATAALRLLLTSSCERAA